MMIMTRALWLGAAAVALAVGCNALLDIDHVEFGAELSAGGTGATGGSTQAAGGATSAGGFPAAAENCANDLDDNSDGLIDCADPLCACAPPAPQSWSGPVVMYTGSGAVSCPADWPAQLAVGWLDADGDDVTCEACACGAPTQLGCTASLSFWTVTNCQGTAARTVQLNGAGCQNITNGQFLSARGGTPTATGSCPAPTGGAILDMPPVIYDLDAVLCGGAASGTSCGASESCVPLPPPPFMGRICIYRSSGGSCPDNDYTEEFEFYETIDDSRGCSTCQCNLNASCTATSSVYPGVTCGGTPTQVPHNNACTAVVAPLSRNFAPSPTGNCTPSGGDPYGGVSGDNAVTVCCLP